MQGMYELRNGSTYSTIPSLNRDEKSWKPYPIEVKKNDHEMLELKIPLQDVNLKGQKNSFKMTTETINQLQIVSND